MTTTTSKQTLLRRLLQPLRPLFRTALMGLVALGQLALPAVGQAQDYTYTTDGATITITHYTGPGGAVNIPDTIDGLPVTSIAGYAFQAKMSLTSVTIPNGVTNIGDFAFSGSGLTSVTIPNKVTTLGYWAFFDCTSLTNVTIPASVTTISGKAFEHCTGLEAITVAGLNPVYSSMDGVLFDKTKAMLIQCPGGKAGNYTIPNSVTSIGDWAFFYCASLTNVTIPQSVTSIGDSAFRNCTSLTSLTIPSSVTSIGDSAFGVCSSLTSIVLPNSVTSIGIGTFAVCTSLTSVTIPNSVTSIGVDAFYLCVSLTNVTIPGSVANLRDEAFFNCTNLTGSYFQGNAPTVGSDVFVGADNATVYYLPGTTGWGPTFGDRPTALWNPQALTSDGSFGLQGNQFGFTITGTADIPLVVEACTNLSSSLWVPLQSCTLTNGSFYFSDPQWTNHARRFYRLRSP